MAKLTEYPAATSFDSGDILIKDGTNGTKKISVDNASVNFIEIANQTVSSSQIAELDDCVLITNDTDGVRKMLVADISGNAHSRELTYSQYQALSNAEKTNGTTYYVTDDPNDRVGGGVNYSTTEQNTGLKWHDGKDIYQRTFTPNLTLTTSWQPVIDATGIDWVTDIEYHITRNGEQTNPVFSSYDVVVWLIRNGYIQFSNNVQSSSGNILVLKDVTIRYTKATSIS